MLKRLPPELLAYGMVLEEYELAQWVWNSHYWIEYAPGMYRCKWCEFTHTGHLPAGKNYPLCPCNPAIKAREAVIKKKIEEDLPTTKEINKVQDDKDTITISWYCDYCRTVHVNVLSTCPKEEDKGECK